MTGEKTAHKWTVNGVLKPLKRVFADTTDDAFNPAGWFIQVQAPDTSSAPSALELSGTVPADDATGVAVDSAIVLTFSIKIATDSIMLMSAAGAVVAAVKTYNAAGKALTLTHPVTSAPEQLTLWLLPEWWMSTVRGWKRRLRVLALWNNSNMW